MKRLVIILIIVALIIGGVVYFLYLNHPSTKFSATSSINSAENPKMSVYSGSVWQISYSANLTPQKVPVTTSELVRFKSTNIDGFVVLVNNAPLAQRDPEISQSKAAGIDLLNEVLALETKNIPPSVKITTSEITQIGNMDVAQVGQLDTSIPTNPSYALKTTFVKWNNLIDITLVVNSTEPTKKEMDKYNSMISSFEFQ